MLLAFLLVAHALGLATSVVALLSTRTSQGTVAWLLALNAFPYVAVPLFWVLGRRRFEGYWVLRRDEDSRLRAEILQRVDSIHPRPPRPEEEDRGGIRAVEALAALPVLVGNRTDLLIDGRAIFDSLRQGIAEAREYILVQFYIVKDDGIGREFRDQLIARAKEGIRIHFLFDEIGSHRLTKRYVEPLLEAGVEVHRFHSTKGPGNRLQVNFRNHRKVMVVDGSMGWLGGINLGDEYLGRDPSLGALRETHLRVSGPAALGLQLSFLEDWNWSTGRTLELRWDPQPAPGGENTAVLILPSGPADPMETGSLLVQHAIHMASKRLWISTPYFIPDGGVMAALRLAALRGVDVRILIPDQPDHAMVGLAGFSFIGGLLEAGVQFFRYHEGFLHAKSILVDQDAVALGTMNVDNRSFRLNFEITALVLDSDFARSVEAMFEADFARSRAMLLEEVRSAPLWYHLGSKAAALFSPVL